MCELCATLRPFDDDCPYELLGPELGEPGDIHKSSSAGDDATVNETTDAPYSAGTSYVLTPGDTFNGSIGFGGDADLVRIELTAGQSYSFSMDGAGGSALADSLLYLFNQYGQSVTLDKNSGAGNNALLNFVAGSTGTYYLGALSATFGTGDYALSAVDNGTVPLLGEFNNDQIASYLTDGYWTDTGRSRRCFDVGADGSLAVDITELTGAGQQFATWALEAWTMVTGINFTFVDETTGATAEIAFDDEVAGSAYSTVTASSGTTVIRNFINVDKNWSGGQAAGDASSAVLNTYTFQTYIHEIGHALGLGHSGNYNAGAGSPYYSAGLDGSNGFINDSWQSSIMSYWSQSNNSYLDATYALIMTPMIADILAVQDLYGANNSIRTGDTTYGANSTAGGYYDQLFGLSGTDFALTILDDGGTDTLDLSPITDGSRIDLNDETHSDIGAGVGNMSIARGTILENVVLGTGDDTVTGNEANNTVTSGGGDLTFDGGTGDDTVILAGNASAYLIAPGSGKAATITGNGDTISLTDVEFVQFDDQTVELFPSANTAPTVAIADQTDGPRVWTTLASVMTVTDAESDAITQYEIRDTSGQHNWWADGGIVDATTGYQTASLGGIWFQTDTVASVQTLSVRAFDGTDWSDWTDFTLTTEVSNQAPTAAMPDVSAGIGTSLLVSDHLVITDPDGDEMAAYRVWDCVGANSFTVDGTAVDASAGYLLNDLSGLRLQADASASQQELRIQAFDGEAWSVWDSFSFNTTAPNVAPVVAIPDQQKDPNVWTLLNDVVSITDANGDTMTTFEVRDTSGASNWWADGGIVDATSGYQTASPGGIWFRADATSSTQTLSFRAFDGTAWSDWEDFTLETIDDNTAPVATASDFSLNVGQTALLSDHLSVTDADLDPILRYQIWDSEGGNNFELNGAPVDASAGYLVDSLANLRVAADAAPSSQTLWVRASDGTDWSGWDSFTFTTATPPPQRPELRHETVDVLIGMNDAMPLEDEPIYLLA